MKSETLNKIDAALRRLEDGSYGDCFECGEEISEARLRALPFAVRCKECEEARETAEQRERMQARKGSSAFPVRFVELSALYRLSPGRYTAGANPSRLEAAPSGAHRSHRQDN
jgi:hypothetical protein